MVIRALFGWISRTDPFPVFVSYRKCRSLSLPCDCAKGICVARFYGWYNGSAWKHDEYVRCASRKCTRRVARQNNADESNPFYSFSWFFFQFFRSASVSQLIGYLDDFADNQMKDIAVTRAENALFYKYIFKIE